MHKFIEIYYFIDEFNKQEIVNLNKNIALIYRNYEKKYSDELIKKIKKICTVQKRKFYIANDLRSAIKFNLDGVYIPAFNKLCNFKNLNVKKEFKILGSAHNIMELKNKENQGCKRIMIAPIFKTKKSKFFLDIVRFNLIGKNTKNIIIALGGLNKANLSKIKLTKSRGFASISLIKKNGPRKLGPF
jgi:thiamine-phosphate pyrophosphorylase